MPLLLKSYESGGDSDEPVGNNGGNTYLPSQSFTLDADAVVGRVDIYVRNTTGITDPITIRLETNSSNLPSGTLVSPNASASFAPVNASYAWIPYQFLSGFKLVGSTKYWVRSTLPAQVSGKYYEWYRDSSSGYADGGESMNFDGSQQAESATIDLYFRIYQSEESGGSPMFFNGGMTLA